MEGLGCVLLAGSVCVDEAAPVLSPGSVCHPGVCVLLCWAWGHPTRRVTHKPGRQCSSEERSGRVSKEGCRHLAGCLWSPAPLGWAGRAVPGSWSVRRAGVSLCNPGAAAGLSP